MKKKIIINDLSDKYAISRLRVENIFKNWKKIKQPKKEIIKVVEMILEKSIERNMEPETLSDLLLKINSGFKKR